MCSLPLLRAGTYQLVGTSWPFGENKPGGYQDSKVVNALAEPRRQCVQCLFHQLDETISLHLAFLSQRHVDPSPFIVAVISSRRGIAQLGAPPEVVFVCLAWSSFTQQAITQ